MRQSGGFLMVEVVVAASVMLVIVSVTLTAFLSTQRLWMRIEQRSVAMTELGAAMDRALIEAADWPADEIKKLPVDPAGESLLRGIEINAKRVADRDGNRVVMTINWQHDMPGGQPIELVGWIDE